MWIAPWCGGVSGNTSLAMFNPFVQVKLLFGAVLHIGDSVQLTQFMSIYAYSSDLCGALYLFSCFPLTIPSMERCPVSKCSSNFSVKLPAFAPDEKLAFVERVCGLLIESRFGPDREYELLVNLAHDPSPNDCTFLEKTPFGIYPSYEYDYLPDSILKQIAIDLVAKHGVERFMPEIAVSASPRGSPATQARA